MNLCKVIDYYSTFSGQNILSLTMSNTLYTVKWIVITDVDAKTISHDILKKIGPTPASFLFIFGLFKQTIQFLQQMNVKNVMSIQYPAPGFKPMTFGT